VGSNPGFIQKLYGKDEPLDDSTNNGKIRDSQMGQVTPKNIF